MEQYQPHRFLFLNRYNRQWYDWLKKEVSDEFWLRCHVINLTIYQLSSGPFRQMINIFDSVIFMLWQWRLNTSFPGNFIVICWCYFFLEWLYLSLFADEKINKSRFTKLRFSKRNDKSIIKEKGEKIKAENNPPGGLYEVYKINIMMSVSKV